MSGRSIITVTTTTVRYNCSRGLLRPWRRKTNHFTALLLLPITATIKHPHYCFTTPTEVTEEPLSSSEQHLLVNERYTYRRDPRDKRIAAPLSHVLTSITGLIVEPHVCTLLLYSHFYLLYRYGIRMTHPLTPHNRLSINGKQPTMRYEDSW